MIDIRHRIDVKDQEIPEKCVRIGEIVFLQEMWNLTRKKNDISTGNGKSYKKNVIFTVYVEFDMKIWHFY